MPTPIEPSYAAAGIFLGLGAAFFQAGSYVASRVFFAHCRNSSRLLFAMSHLIMGMVALLLFPFLLDNALPPFRTWGGYLLGTAGAYLFGQFMLFMALRRMDSSMAAPLLGFKIPLLGLFTAFFLHQNPSFIQWFAMLLCVAAGLVISPPTSLPAAGGLLLVLLATVGYCASDLCIPHLVQGLETASDTPVLLAVSTTYIVCGIVGLLLSAHQRILTDWNIIRFAAPHAITWMIGMFFLFGAFATIGVIPGNMLQSTRGIIAVGLGMIITQLGLLRIEDLSNRKVLLRRALGAVLMTVAIVIYLSN